MDCRRLLPREQAIFWFLCVGALEGIGAAVYLLRIPTDPKNAIFLGYSLNRMIIFLLILLGSFGMVYIAISIHKKRVLKIFQRLETSLLGKSEPKFIGLIAVFFLSWIIFFLPSYRLGAYPAYYERIYPLLFWLALLVTQGLGIYFMAYRGVDIFRFRTDFQRQTSLLFVLGIVFLLSLGIWLMIGLSGLGIRPDDRYWNEAGVPLLGLQVLIVVAGSFVVGGWIFGEFSEKKPIRGHKLDFFVGLLLWLSAAVIWNLAPFERSHFAPAPVPPNNSYYPFSDAESYDTGAQFLLIGQGLNNHQYHDKPFYVFLLAMLRLLGGQDTLRVAGFQAMFLALLPACVYLIGVSFNQRTAGLIAGLLVILKEYNAIGAVLKIQVSHSRLFLTEMPTALGIALLALVSVEWMRFPQHRTKLTLIGGGVLGILMLVRTNTLFLIPIFLLWIVTITRSWRMRVRTTLFFFVGIGLVVSPWFLAGKTPEGRTFLDEKFNSVISTRYNVDPKFVPDLGTNINSPAAGPSNNGSGLQSSFKKILYFAPNHFFHNLAMSVLAFPLSLRLDDLDETLSASYWRINWNGNLTHLQGILLAINLLILAIGVGTAFFSAGWVGFLPLTFYVGYHVANALARTSGGRYLVPVDWVLVLYFGLGLFQLFGWVTSAAGIDYIITKPILLNLKPESLLGSWKTLFCIVLLASIGSSLLWVGNFIPTRYSDQGANKTIEGVLADLNASGIQKDTALNLLNSPGAVVFRGRALYPKFFKAGHGEVCPGGSRDLLDADYPHLMLRVIGPQRRCVRLPVSEMKEPFPDAADVVVIGCEDDKHEVNALAVVVEESNRQVLLRSPSTTWRCPLIPPVCWKDGTCQ